MYIHIEGTAGLNVDLDKRYSTYEEAVDGIKEVLGSLGGFYDAEAIAREVIVSDFERSGRHSLGGVEYFISPGIASVSPEQVEEFLNQHLLVTEEEILADLEPAFSGTEAEQEFARAYEHVDGAFQSMVDMLSHRQRLTESQRDLAVGELAAFKGKVTRLLLEFGEEYAATSIARQVLNRLGLTDEPSGATVNEPMAAAGQQQLIDDLQQQNLKLIDQLRERDDMLDGLHRNSRGQEGFRRNVIVAVLGYAAVYDAPEVGEQVLEYLGLSTAEL